MILDQSGIFTQSIQSNNTSIIPVVVFSKNNINYYISTNAVTMDGNYYEPLLLNIPSIRESVDFEKRNFKISSISLSVSNSVYSGDKRFSDNLSDIINAECFIYYKTTVTKNLNDCLKVYQGKVKRMSHDATTINLQLEDLSQENLHKDLPSERLDADLDYLEKYRNKPVGIVYGNVKNHKVVISPIDNESDYLALVDNQDVFGYETKHPLKISLEDKLCNVLENTLDTYSINEDLFGGSDYAEDVEQYYIQNDNNFRLNRTEFDGQSNYNSVSPLAHNKAFIVHKNTPKDIKINNRQYDGTFTVFVNGLPQEIPDYYNNNFNVINTPIELINKSNLLDNDNNNYTSVTSTNANIPEFCKLYKEIYSAYIDMQYLQLTADFETLDTDSSKYINIHSYPNIAYKIYANNFYEFSGSLPQARVVTTAKDHTNRLEYMTEQGTSVGDLWNYAINPYYNYKHNIGLDISNNHLHLMNNIQNISVFIFPTNISQINNINSFEILPRFFEFSLNHLMFLKEKLFDKDFYVDIKGRNRSSDWDYRKIRYETIASKDIGTDVVNNNNIKYRFTNEGALLLEKDSNFLIEKLLKPSDIIHLFTNTDELFLIAQIENIETYSENEEEYLITINAVDYYLPYLIIDINNYNDQGYYTSNVDNVKIKKAQEYIELPCDIMKNLLETDIGFDSDSINQDELELAREESKGYYFSISQTEEINSKKLIEKIARQSKFFPKFKNDGTFGFNTIKDEYTGEEAEKIKIKDIINYKFDRTKIDDIKTQVKIIYGKDNITDDYLKSTNYITASQYFDSEENQYLNNYYGLEEDHRTSTLDFEAEYIQQEETAILLRNFLLSWYANQHNIINIDLPLQYIKYEVGDIVEFDGLINNLKLYGEDYTRPNNRNGQDIYPYFMVMQTVKNINKITFKLVQLHKNLPIEQQEQIESDLNTIGGKIPLEQEMDTVLLKSPNLVSAEDIMPRTETQDDDGQDTGGSGY
tara:strand:- start:411 stop:3359 length:2949 start_codon:yes stop_codon:yes gene_type:complete